MTVTINGTTGYSGPVGTIGDLTTTGNTTLGDASSDTLTLNGNTASIPNGLNFTNGNIGVGVTPSAWSLGKAFEITGVGNAVWSPNAVNDLRLISNIYYNGGYKYAANGYANMYQVGGTNGTHSWYNAASGTAGAAITFTQAMTLDASGNLGVGTTSPTSISNYKSLTVNGTTGGLVDIASNGTVGLRLQCDTTYPGGALFTLTNQPMIFGTNGTERARISSSGRIFIGNTSTLGSGSEYAITLGGAGSQLYMSATGNTTSYGAVTNPMLWGTNGLTIGCDNNNIIQFIRYVNGSTSVTENARFDGSGNFVMSGATVWGSGGALCGPFGSFGSGSTNAKAIVWGQYSSSAGVPHICGNWASSYSWGIGPHSSSNDNILRIGTITGSNNSGVSWIGGYVNIYAGAYTNASDYRIKENVADVADGVLEKVLALRVVNYNIIHQPDEDGDTPPIKDEVGFIAHEIQAQFPVLVSGDKDAVDGEGNPQHQGVDYAKLSAYLVKAIQELKAEFDAYKLTHP